MNITIPQQIIPGQIITIKAITITVQPEPLEVNGQTIPQVPQTFTIPEHVVTTSDYVCPSYVITVADPVPVPPVVVPPVVTSPPTARRLFSPESFYNKKLADSAPIHANSAGMVAELLSQCVPGSKTPYYGNVNSQDYTAAMRIVTDPNTPKVPVYHRSNGVDQDWSGDLYLRLKAGIRLPVNAIGNAGTDGHIVIWDQVDDILYELWQFKYVNNQWQCSFGGIIDNVSNSLGVFPALKNKWGAMFETGATATSLPLAGGMIKAKEMAAGVIPHVIGFAIPQGPNKFVPPARRTDGGVQFYEGANAIPAGTRFRFPKDIAIDPNWIPLVKMMVIAIRDYGCVVQDRSGATCFYAENTAHLGVPDSTSAYRKKADGSSLQGWQFMNPNYFPYSKMQVVQP